MKLDVPHYSQFVDIQDPFWMLRACGACSLKEVAEFHGKEVADIVSLCNEAKDHGGYDLENGWVHDYLVAKLQELGLDAYRKEGIESLDEIISCLKEGNPMMVSVEKRVLEQTRFHIIVLTGFEEHDGTVTDFYYHESESTNKEKGKHRKVSVDTFKEYFRGKAIFAKKA